MTNTTPKPELPSSAGEHGLWRSDSAFDGTSHSMERTTSLVNTMLGPFEVHDVIGQGAMSVVLSGVHAEQGVSVAIKAITDDANSDPRFRRHLRDEVQAVARLNHPGIVMVFDYGATDASTEELTDGRVQRGTPYFVMERTREGTLADLVSRVTWPKTRALLLSILDGLAHAHAHGVIHRDIKPRNILLSRWGGRIVPKLADFGIAYAMEGGTSFSSSVGTPRYMAPEQIDQSWRKHGPWSDLFSLGCIAYELLSGRKFFDGEGVDRVYRQHFRSQHPPFSPVVPVPTAFDQWLTKLLHLEPEERFQTAADAARALADIPPEIPADQTVHPDARPVDFDVATLTPVLDPLLSDDTDADDTSGVDDLQVLPADWPSTTIKPRPIHIVGAGIGLYGLRNIPLVGREPELEQMWSTFRDVSETGDDQICLVRGSQGCGKSKLVDSFTRRLKEFGAAHVLEATHSSAGGPADGLSGMLARHFRTLDAPDSEVERIVDEAMGDVGDDLPYELGTMLQILRPSLDEDQIETGVQIASPSQRYAVMRRYFESLADDRPVVLVCDDIQWGMDTLDFARHMLRSETDGAAPVMLVMVATDEVLAERSTEREIVDDLVERPNVEQLKLDPLEDVHHERLIEDLLLLEGDLAREVTRRTSGNPLLAVELIGDWIDRGLLEVGERGFVLADDVEPTIPDHLHEVWVHRLDSLLEDYSDNARKALEMAAALGQDVRTDEWAAACDLAGIYLDQSLAADLVERRFARRTERGWSFAHAIFHESAERLARDAGRWLHYRRICADLLEINEDTNIPRVAERFGRYAMSAHQFERALEPLLRGARGRRRRGEYRAAQQLLSDYIECLEEMGVPDDDRRWGEVQVLRARTYLNDDDPRESRRWARRALDAAEEHGWTDIRPQAMGWTALAEQWLGRKDATVRLKRAARLLEDVETDHRMLGVFGSVAHGLTTMREFDKAQRLLELDAEQARQHRDDRAIANNLSLRCRLAFYQQNWEDALDYAERALSRFQAVGNLPGAVTSQEYMAEIHRVTGNTEHAESIYRQCMKLQEAIGFRKSIAQTNLATILLKRGEAAEAEQLFLMAADAFEASGRRPFQVVALAGVLACASSQGWSGNLEDHLEPIRAFNAETDKAERDLAELLEFAGDHLVEDGRQREAYETYQLAREQWQRLDAADRVEAIGEKVHSLY